MLPQANKWKAQRKKANDFGITYQQLEVLRMLAHDDLTMREIGANLNIGEGAVYNRIRRVKQKLGLTTIPAIVHDLTKKGVL